MYFWLFHLYRAFNAKRSGIEKEEINLCKYETYEHMVIEDTLASLSYFSEEVYNQKKFIKMLKEVVE